MVLSVIGSTNGILLRVILPHSHVELANGIMCSHAVRAFEFHCPQLNVTEIRTIRPTHARPLVITDVKYVSIVVPQAWLSRPIRCAKCNTMLNA